MKHASCSHKCVCFSTCIYLYFTLWNYLHTSVYINVLYILQIFKGSVRKTFNRCLFLTFTWLVRTTLQWWQHMETPFCITDPLWWQPVTRKFPWVSHVEIVYFLYCQSEKTVEQTLKLLGGSDAPHLPCNDMPSKVWDEITYPFPSFGNG